MNSKKNLFIRLSLAALICLIIITLLNYFLLGGRNSLISSISKAIYPTLAVIMVVYFQYRLKQGFDKGPSFSKSLTVASLLCFAILFLNTWLLAGTNITGALISAILCAIIIAVIILILVRTTNKSSRQHQYRQ